MLMARARKSSLAADGMGLLQVMPFPALNPWNWWALAAPRNAMLAGMHNCHAALQAWRVGADCMRAAVREQQDAMLALWETPPASEPEHEAEAAPADVAAANGAHKAEAADFMTPMLEATRAYGRVGKAFIVAQRNTMRAFAETGKPH